ncbi:hypothetical protein [uncultured Methylobacterium sp.]|uniref:hypothetical protein n=1 Tax=uncultured Methylobacterium sp. TaxID=157278 RepID=UPI0025965FA1|nr:hypothetical protein [uncultured Methylobacterium sp.]
MIRSLLFFAALAFALAGPLVYAGPQLVSDVQVGDRWVLVDDLAIKESKCTRWYFLVSTCHIEYVNRRDPSRVGGTLNYLVFGSWSGERARLLRATSDPNRIGTTLGLEHMQQRVVSFGVFFVLLLAFLALIIRLGFSAARTSAPDAGGIRAEQFGTAPGGRTFDRRTDASARST